MRIQFKPKPTTSCWVKKFAYLPVKLHNESWLFWESYMTWVDPKYRDSYSHTMEQAKEFCIEEDSTEWKRFPGANTDEN